MNLDCVRPSVTTTGFLYQEVSLRARRTPKTEEHKIHADQGATNIASWRYLPTFVNVRDEVGSPATLHCDAGRGLCFANSQGENFYRLRHHAADQRATRGNHPPFGTRSKKGAVAQFW